MHAESAAVSIRFWLFRIRADYEATSPKDRRFITRISP